MEFFLAMKGKVRIFVISLSHTLCYNQVYIQKKSQVISVAKRSTKGVQIMPEKKEEMYEFYIGEQLKGLGNVMELDKNVENHLKEHAEYVDKGYEAIEQNHNSRKDVIWETLPWDAGEIEEYGLSKARRRENRIHIGDVSTMDMQKNAEGIAQLITQKLARVWGGKDTSASHDPVKVNIYVDEKHKLFKENIVRNVKKWIKENYPERMKEVVGEGMYMDENTYYFPDDMLTWNKSEIKNVKNESLFAEGQPKPEDVIQTDNRFCYMLAPLRALTVAHKDKIKNLITDNNDGTVTVHFFRKNKDNQKVPYNVVVDKTVGDWDTRMANWGRLVEKAFMVGGLGAEADIQKSTTGFLTNMCTEYYHSGKGGDVTSLFEAVSPAMEDKGDNNNRQALLNPEMEESTYLDNKFKGFDPSNTVMSVTKDGHAISVLGFQKNKNGEWEIEYQDQLQGIVSHNKTKATLQELAKKDFKMLYITQFHKDGKQELERIDLTCFAQKKEIQEDRKSARRAEKLKASGGLEKICDKIIQQFINEKHIIQKFTDKKSEQYDAAEYQAATNFIRNDPGMKKQVHRFMEKFLEKNDITVGEFEDMQNLKKDRATWYMKQTELKKAQQLHKEIIEEKLETIFQNAATAQWDAQGRKPVIENSDDKSYKISQSFWDVLIEGKEFVKDMQPEEKQKEEPKKAKEERDISKWNPEVWKILCQEIKKADPFFMNGLETYRNIRSKMEEISSAPEKETLDELNTCVEQYLQSKVNGPSDSYGNDRLTAVHEVHKYLDSLYPVKRENLGEMIKNKTSHLSDYFGKNTNTKKDGDLYALENIAVMLNTKDEKEYKKNMEMVNGILIRPGKADETKSYYCEQYYREHFDEKQSFSAMKNLYQTARKKCLEERNLGDTSAIMWGKLIGKLEELNEEPYYKSKGGFIGANHKEENENIKRATEVAEKFFLLKDEARNNGYKMKLNEEQALTIMEYSNLERLLKAESGAFRLEYSEISKKLIQEFIQETEVYGHLCNKPESGSLEKVFTESATRNALVMRQSREYDAAKRKKEGTKNMQKQTQKENQQERERKAVLEEIHLL